MPNVISDGPGMAEAAAERERRFWQENKDFILAAACALASNPSYLPSIPTKQVLYRMVGEASLIVRIVCDQAGEL
jgi:hypothetical protein